MKKKTKNYRGFIVIGVFAAMAVFVFSQYQNCAPALDSSMSVGSQNFTIASITMNPSGTVALGGSFTASGQLAPANDPNVKCQWSILAAGGIPVASFPVQSVQNGICNLNAGIAPTIQGTYTLTLTATDSVTGNTATNMVAFTDGSGGNCRSSGQTCVADFGSNASCGTAPVIPSPYYGCNCCAGLNAVLAGPPLELQQNCAGWVSATFVCQ